LTKFAAASEFPGRFALSIQWADLNRPTFAKDADRAAELPTGGVFGVRAQVAAPFSPTFPGVL